LTISSCIFVDFVEEAIDLARLVPVTFSVTAFLFFLLFSSFTSRFDKTVFLCSSVIISGCLLYLSRKPSSCKVGWFRDRKLGTKQAFRRSFVPSKKYLIVTIRNILDLTLQKLPIEKIIQLFFV